MPWPVSYGLLIVLATIWSSSFFVIKIGVADIPPASLAAGRILLAAMVLYGVMLARGHRLTRWGPVWRLYFLVGLFGNGLPFFLINWGEQFIPSGVAAIMMAVMPLATLVLTHLFTTDERLTVLRLAGVLLGFGGVLVLVGAEALSGVGVNVVAQLAVAGGALSYAIATTTARHIPHLAVEERGAGVMMASALIMVPVALFFDQPWQLTPSANAIGAMVYLGLFPTALATIIYFVLISARGATFISFNNYIIPVLGVVWGVLFLGEVVTVRALLALGLILCGIALAGRRQGVIYEQSRKGNP